MSRDLICSLISDRGRSGPRSDEVAELQRLFRVHDPEASCGPVTRYACAVTFDVIYITRVDSSTFGLVTDWWQRYYPIGPTCLVRVTGDHEINVSCPLTDDRQVKTQTLCVLICSMIRVAALCALSYTLWVAHQTYGDWAQETTTALFM